MYIVSLSVYTVHSLVFFLKTSLVTLQLLLCALENIVAIGVQSNLVVRTVEPLPNWFGYLFHSLTCVGGVGI